MEGVKLSLSQHQNHEIDYWGIQNRQKEVILHLVRNWSMAVIFKLYAVNGLQVSCGSLEEAQLSVRSLGDVRPQLAVQCDL